MDLVPLSESPFTWFSPACLDFYSSFFEWSCFSRFHPRPPQPPQCDCAVSLSLYDMALPSQPWCESLGSCKGAPQEHAAWFTVAQLGECACVRACTRRNSIVPSQLGKGEAELGKMCGMSGSLQKAPLAQVHVFICWLFFYAERMQRCWNAGGDWCGGDILTKVSDTPGTIKRLRQRHASLRHRGAA